MNKMNLPCASTEIVCCLLLIASLFLSAAVNAKTTVVAVQGLAGEDYYQRHFDEQIDKIKTASSKLTDDDNLVVFSGELEKESILTALGHIVENSASDDLLVMYLIGHGSFDGRDYKFNISGPDITGSELLELFSQTSASIALVNTSSSSGALLKLFEETFEETSEDKEIPPKLTLVTATKSGAERTATRFGRHLADALIDSQADVNKNQSISLQEAYDFAVRETEGFFDTEGLLATENARLQLFDGASQPNQIRLANLTERPVINSNSELAVLYQQRDELDRQIDTLRLRRINMSEDDYLEQFQTLMIQLSLLQGEIEAESDTQ